MEHSHTRLLKDPQLAMRDLSKASWLYPLKGIYYFISHPFLYPLFRARLIPALLLSTFVYANLFIWTYFPQVAFLFVIHFNLGWLNFVTAALWVLGEGAVIVALLFEAFFVDETLVDVFDAVLLNEGCGDLVAQGRILHPEGQDPVKQLGKPMSPAIYSPFSFRQIAEFVIFLPLNLIPVAGTPVFLVLTGYRAGPLQHWRYFKLLGHTKAERNDYIRQRTLKYTWFGSIALLLQLVPVLSMLFLMTTATGSALWVVDLELRRLAADDELSVEDGRAEFADEPVYTDDAV